MAITPVEINTSPAAATGVYLYDTDGAKGLTFGQLLAAVCLRTGAILESQSVGKMNDITKGNAATKRLSDVLERLSVYTVDGWQVNHGTDFDWADIRAELAEHTNLNVINLPSSVTSFADLLLAMSTIKGEIERNAQVSQREMIDLQTIINRRDVAFTTATNLIRALGQSSMNAAGKIR